MSAYKFLVRQLKLPSLSTVLQWMTGIQFEDGFDPFVFQLLNDQVSTLNKEDQVCTLLMDEDSLKTGLQYEQKSDSLIGIKCENGQKSFSSTAMVFMVHRICEHWKQAVAFVSC